MPLTNAVWKHYAQFLGEPSTGYLVKLKEHPEGQYDIAQYEDVPWKGAVTLATCGFSDVPLHMFRQELVLLCYERFVSKDLILMLAGVMEMVADSQHPLLQGRVLVPWLNDESLMENTTMSSLYSAVPTYFPDEFQIMRDAEESIDVGWLIPIHRSEADWIKEHGWEAFESRLVELDPDVIDLTRPPIV
jgi:hypothetical protein